MKAIFSKLGVTADENKFTKVIKNPTVFNKIKDNINLHPNYNEMVDLLFLPEDKSEMIGVLQDNVYLSVDKDKLTKLEQSLYKKINKIFYDTDDKTNYVVVDIVKKKRSKTLYYKYYDYDKYKNNAPDSENDYEYTDTNIFINAKWVTKLRSIKNIILQNKKEQLGYKYLLVCVDLATDKFDIEPLKTKDPDETLSALKTIWSRPYVKKPYASIRADNGSEFKGSFMNYCYNESILLKFGYPDRHKQQANVERLNRTLAELINGYLNSQEIKTKKKATNWIEILPTIRKELNKIREKDPSEIKQANFDNLILKDNIKSEDIGVVDSTRPLAREKHVYNQILPKYKVGDEVHVKYEVPHDALGQKQNTKIFRSGDYRLEKEKRRIVKILYYPPPINYRYLVSGRPNVSYVEQELIRGVDSTRPLARGN